MYDNHLNLPQRFAMLDFIYSLKFYDTPVFFTLCSLIASVIAGPCWLTGPDSLHFMFILQMAKRL